ncbi:hypothetical protein LTR36_001790 [Oleoguttula mirabilis]|uniref:Uncharacterized protein n=1 Tax=Oleoguttula mirabilis TaxID=1507867 RepID=A0AAV9JM22_9PEZI|nr:hypothetical protein LTR36_001790 [Oleoguttula mirabilis]
MGTTKPATVARTTHATSGMMDPPPEEHGSRGKGARRARNTKRKRELEDIERQPEAEYKPHPSRKGGKGDDKPSAAKKATRIGLPVSSYSASAPKEPNRTPAAQPVSISVARCLQEAASVQTPSVPQAQVVQSKHAYYIFFKQFREADHSTPQQSSVVPAPVTLDVIWECFPDPSPRAALSKLRRWQNNLGRMMERLVEDPAQVEADAQAGRGETTDELEWVGVESLEALTHAEACRLRKFDRYDHRLAGDAEPPAAKKCIGVTEGRSLLGASMLQHMILRQLQNADKSVLKKIFGAHTEELESDDEYFRAAIGHGSVSI